MRKLVIYLDKKNTVFVSVYLQVYIAVKEVPDLEPMRHCPR